MASLTAKSPCDGLLPLSFGSVRATEVDLGVLTSLAPFQGQEAAFSDSLKSAHGMAWPAANRATGREGARCLFFGMGQALLAGPSPDPDLSKLAALTDQSDAWATVRIEGAAAEDVLARLIPLDLRGPSFKRGHTARTQIGHMAGSVTRIGDQAFLLMVFRSMAKTLVHDLETAMRSVASRA